MELFDKDINAYQCVSCGSPMPPERIGAHSNCLNCAISETRRLIRVRKFYGALLLVFIFLIFLGVYFNESSVFDRNKKDYKFIYQQVINNEIVLNSVPPESHYNYDNTWDKKNLILLKAYSELDDSDKREMEKQITHSRWVCNFFKRNNINLGNIDHILASIDKSNVAWITDDDFVELMLKSLPNNTIAPDITLKNELIYYRNADENERVNICKAIDIISYIKIKKFVGNEDEINKINHNNKILLKYIYNTTNKYETLFKMIHNSKYIDNFGDLYKIAKYPIPRIDYAPKYRSVPQELTDELKNKNENLQIFLATGRMIRNDDIDMKMQVISRVREYQYGVKITIAQAYYESLNESISETKKKINEINNDIDNCKKQYSVYVVNNNLWWDQLKHALRANEIHDMS